MDDFPGQAAGAVGRVVAEADAALDPHGARAHLGIYTHVRKRVLC